MWGGSQGGPRVGRTPWSAARVYPQRALVGLCGMVAAKPAGGPAADQGVRPTNALRLLYLNYLALADAHALRPTPRSGPVRSAAAARSAYHKSLVQLSAARIHTLRSSGMI